MPNRLADATWVLRLPDSPLRNWLVAQVRSLCLATTGAEPRFAAEPSGPFSIVVETAGPVSDDFTLRGGSPLRITGGSARAAAYGVFRLFEELGWTFLLSRDLPPARNPEARVPDLDIREHTDSRSRGVWFQYCFATNSMMSLGDYERLFDQMARLRLASIVFYHFENEPFLDWSFRGERKLVGDISHPDSGYLSYGRTFSGSYLVKDLEVGAERFGGRRRVAPLELQDAASSAEALDAATGLMRAVMAAAQARGIGCWTSFLPQFVPLNLAKHLRRMPRPHPHWSALVSTCDPVVDEMNRARLRALLESYPHLEGIYLGIPEGYYEDPYPDSRELVAKEMPRYREALELHLRYWGAYWKHDEKELRAHLERDVGFVEVLKRTIDIVRELAPDHGLGVITVCKAYLLTALHRDLPSDIRFADIESRSLWTVDGAPLHLFREMRGRECAVIPRAVDDGSLAGMQFDLELYDKDGFIRSVAENGTSGLVIQLTHVRGNEHNVGYLAAGMWNPALTPEAWYARYCRALVGPAAAPILARAFAELERSEQELGGRGQANMPWNQLPAQIDVLRRFRDHATPFLSAPYDQAFVATCAARARKYEAAIARLDQALLLYREAVPASTEAGRRELAYLRHRAQSYRAHLQALVELAGIYADYRDAFDLLDHRDLQPFRRALESVVARAGQAHALARLSAEEMAACAEHPTDLGVLWMLAKSMVTGTRVLGGWLANVLAYYQGREYWRDLDWHLLFGSSPYPTHGLEAIGAEPG